jgi:transcriptional regulator with XRE-family HTH domain
MPDSVAIISEGVAATVRRLRVNRGWTLDVLAERSGVSRGMLIQIEQARTNPSLGTLIRVAEAFGVTLARLVDVTTEEVVRLVPAADAVTAWTSPSGASRATLLVGTDPARGVELWRWMLDAGDSRACEPHPAGTMVLLSVQDGDLTLDVDGASYVVGPGDGVVFHADRRHRYANTAQRPLRFVMVIATPGRPTA